MSASASAGALRELAEVCRRWGVEKDLCDQAQLVASELNVQPSLVRQVAAERSRIDCMAHCPISSNCSGNAGETCLT